MKRTSISLVCLAVVLGMFTTDATAQFALGTYVFGNGAVSTSSGTNNIIGTLGQPQIGLAAQSMNRAYEGFWYTQVKSLVGIEVEGSSRNSAMTLDQNYPNPFSGSTLISLRDAPHRSFTLAIYAVSGKRVRLENKEFDHNGEFQFHWDGTGDGGRVLPSGSYFYRVFVGNTILQQQAILLR